MIVKEYKFVSMQEPYTRWYDTRRYHQQKYRIPIRYISVERQVVDTLIKSLDKNKFNQLLMNLGVHDHA